MNAGHEPQGTFLENEMLVQISNERSGRQGDKWKEENRKSSRERGRPTCRVSMSSLLSDSSLFKNNTANEAKGDFYICHVCAQTSLMSLVGVTLPWNKPVQLEPHSCPPPCMWKHSLVLMFKCSFLKRLNSSSGQI